MEYKPIVANTHVVFFEKSETFIHNYLTNLKSYKPICLSLNYRNLDLFNFPEKDLYYLNKKGIFNWPNFINSRLDFKNSDVIKKLNVKLIHAHFGHNGYHSLPLKRKYKVPLVTTFYDFDASKLPRKKRWRKNYKVLFKEGDLFLVEGNHMRLRLIELGCPEEKVQIQRIAIPVQKISTIKQSPAHSSQVNFIFSGRFVEKKGLIYTLKAINKLKHKYTNFEFRIIGDGPLKKSIEKYITQHNLKKYVKLLGFLKYDDYLNEMSKADIFVHPSITAADGDSEGGAPTTILEAQALGMPVIATYHADIENIVVPQKSALLSKEKDVNSLAKNMANLIENRNKWLRMGITGKKFINKFHDIKTEARKLEEKYDHVIQSAKQKQI